MRFVPVRLCRSCRRLLRGGSRGMSAGRISGGDWVGIEDGLHRDYGLRLDVLRLALGEVLKLL